MILKDVSKQYKDICALKNVTMEIEEGKITAVLGESGAGKTTLLNVLAGLIPFEGEIDGEKYSPKHRKNCSYLYQDAKLLPNLTAEGNLKFVLKKEEWGGISDMLEKVGLGEKKNVRPGELSGGERQRVAIARAFLFPHRILLMDEPFSSLDLYLKRGLMELVYSLWKERGSTVVFVTHDVREAAVLAHRAVILQKGELREQIEIDAPFPRDFLNPPAEMNVLVEKLLRRDP